MTGLLSRLGLQLAAGANPAMLYGVLALVAATVAAGGWSVWYLAHLGKAAAIAECERARRTAEDGKREAERQLGEAQREVTIRHTRDATRLEQRSPGVHQEADDYAKNHPELDRCRLTDDGLRQWNADPLDADVPLRQAAPGRSPAEPSARGVAELAGPDPQPGGLETRLQGALPATPGPQGAGGALHRRASGPGAPVALAHHQEASP